MPITAYPHTHKRIFVVCWFVLLTLYFPTLNAGFVTDSVSWLNGVTTSSFWGYLNRDFAEIKSQYQFTQFITYLFYLVIGTHSWLWHLLFITLQALNASILFRLCQHIFTDSKINNATIIAAGGVLLFCICPHISEVMVWIACYHYLQGLLFILLILWWVLQYLYTGYTKYAWWAGIVYFISTYALEVCYLTPWLVLALIFYYRHALQWDKAHTQKALLIFFLPLLVLFAIYLLEYRLLYGEWVSHRRAGTAADIQISMLGKAPKYLFQLLFLGRFWNPDTIKKIYAFCDSTKGIAVLYGGISVLLGILIIWFKRWSSKTRALTLILIWTLVTLALLIPIGFYDLTDLVVGDRCTYCTNAFLFMLVALMISYLPSRALRIGCFIIYAIVNIYFTMKVNRYWQQSGNTLTSLLQHTPPEAKGRTIILLNLPENMHGIPIIGASSDGNYKQMHNLLYSTAKLNDTIYETASYLMGSMVDSVYTQWLNDSTLKVSLATPEGSWWERDRRGLVPYENEAYNLFAIDGGSYTFILKRPRNHYLIVYAANGTWHVVQN